MGRVGMDGWLNFSSDHVEPIKADHGTQPPPPTSSTFFVLSLFPPRVLAFIHPLAAPPPPPHNPTRAERVLFLGSALFPLSRFSSPSSPATRPSPASRRRASSAFRLVFLLFRRVHSLALWQLVGFFRVTRRCNLFGRGRERYPRARRWSTRSARRGSWATKNGGREQRRVSRENRWRR